MNEILKYTKAKKQKKIFLTLALCSFIFLLMIIYLMIGQTSYSFDTVVRALLGEMIPQASFAIQVIRWPRLLLGILCGFAFGISGHVFQKMLGNPLASPDIIGVSAGASVAAVFCLLILHLSGQIVSLFAIIGGLLTSAIVYLLAKDSSNVHQKIILIGLGMQAFLNAIISYLLLNGAQYDVASAMRWLSGSLNNASIDTVFRILPIIVGCTIVLLIFYRHLHIIELGEQIATTLGLNVTISRIIIFVLALILIAAATSATGPIASVSFLAGPISQKIMKDSQANLIQAGLVGIILVLLGDFVAQNFLPARYPVGVVTGLLGAPYLLYMLLGMNKKEKITNG